MEIKRCIYIPVGCTPYDNNVTKRKVISLMSNIFDPLQVLAPYTICAKILMLQSWLRGVGWNEPSPTDLAELWKTWLKHLPDLASLQVPHCYNRKGKTVVMGAIHTFVDAFEQACATVSYLRQEYDDGDVSVIFVAAKPRIAPFKVVIVPRLELVTVVIGVRLGEFVGNSWDMLVKNTFSGVILKTLLTG